MVLDSGWAELHFDMDADPLILVLTIWLARPDNFDWWLTGSISAYRNERPGRRVKCTGYNLLLSRVLWEALLS